MIAARRIVPLGAVACLLAFAGSTALPTSPARAASGGAWWSLNTTVAPSLLPRSGEAQILVTPTDLGDAPLASPGGDPIVVTDTLPTGLTPVATEPRYETAASHSSCAIAGQTVTCTATGTVAPYQALMTLVIVVEVHEPAAASPENIVRIEGGQQPDGAPPAPLTHTQPLRFQKLEDEPIPFGVEAYALTPEDEHGERDPLAGSHPFQLTTLLDFDQRLEPTENPQQRGAGKAPGEPGGGWPSVSALPRNLNLKLPPGLIGDPTAVPQCSDAQFKLLSNAEFNRCPAASAIGVAQVVLFDPGPLLLLRRTVPVFNLQPAPGEPARFGFVAERVPVVLKTALPAGGDYAVEVATTDISQVLSILSSQVTLWGVPGDPRHDASRGWACLDEKKLQEENLDVACEPPHEPSPTAFLTLPTSCQSAPQPTLSASSWAAGQSVPEQSFSELPVTSAFPQLAGCESLEFDPSFTTSLETPFASTPTGINGTLTFPQTGLTEPEGRAESALSDTTLLLPEGVQVNPSAANGLAACSEEQVGYTGQNPATGIYEYTPAQPHCPQASKVATVHARTPLLAEELTGALYVMEPAPNDEAGKNPFNALVGLYVVLEAPNSGILVKLGADIHLNEQTGREEGVFPGTPQLPFHELTLSFFGGPRAATASPAFCGSYQLAGAFTGWAGATANPLSQPPFQITAGPEGSACPEGQLPFSPSFAAGPESPQAGAFSPVVVDVARPDGDQAVSGLSVTEPPGFAAVLASVQPCPEPPPGVEWSCGESSHIGDVNSQSGLGSDPVRLTGQAYLTSGYDGAPFGLLVRTLAQAGPFNLGWVDVRSRINVNPSTAQVTVTTDPGPRGEALPTMLKGIPVQLKALEVAVNRPGFTFNPTNCTPTAYTATLSGSEGAAAPVSSSFTAEGCGALPFHPTLEASTQGQASKADGASLDVKVTSQGLGVANIQKVFLTIPRILPSRLQPTLQHACLAAVFEANPAGCDEDSLIGTATVHTPILKSPLTGPAYVVSHGGAAFPDVEFVLQGEGITLIVDGKTDIKHGVTYSRFESTPDAPFTTFETVLPAGPHSILAVNTEEAPDYDLCGHTITAPTEITAQNGAVIEQETKLQVTGCAAVKSAKTKKPTLAQQLTRALQKCRTSHEHSAPARAACERKARASYTAKATALCRKQDKHSRTARRACETNARREYASIDARRRAGARR